MLNVVSVKMAHNGIGLCVRWRFKPQMLNLKTKLDMSTKDKSKNETANGTKPVLADSGFVSGCCKGEICSVCGKPATNKLEETIFYDDPNKMRHPLTAYVCREHFRMIVGGLG
jgi:hypothetical protein